MTKPLALPHRRFVFEGVVDEHTGRGGARSGRHTRQLYLFNDLLVNACAPTSARGELPRCTQIVDVIHLSKVTLTDDSKSGGSFELKMMARTWRFSVNSAEDQLEWVKKIKKQVRFVNKAFNERGKSIGFVQQNVGLLRDQLTALQKQCHFLEEQVLEATTVLCALDAEQQEDLLELGALMGSQGNLSLTVALSAPFSDESVGALKSRLQLREVEKAELHTVANKCIGEIVSLMAQADEIKERHNSDSMCECMLFSGN